MPGRRGYRAAIYVVEARPNEYFAYRSDPGGSSFLGNVRTVSNSLVEFQITEDAGACTVVVTESGFCILPSDVAESSFQQTSSPYC